MPCGVYCFPMSVRFIDLLVGYAVAFPIVLAMIGISEWWGWLGRRESRWVLAAGVVGAFIAIFH